MRPGLDVSADPIVAVGVRWCLARLGVRMFRSRERCAVNSGDISSAGQNSMRPSCAGSASARGNLPYTRRLAQTKQWLKATAQLLSARDRYGAAASASILRLMRSARSSCRSNCRLVKPDHPKYASAY